MDVPTLAQLHETIWLWLVVPLTALASVALSVRLLAPQIRSLPAAFAGLRAHDPDAEGEVPPASSMILSWSAAFGAAAAVGAATAVSLGGVGVVFYVWVFALVLAPLRMAEVLLARTAPAGAAGTATGSLPGRLLEDPYGGIRVLGWVLLVLTPVIAFAFVGGVHGDAVHQLAVALLPEQAVVLGLAVAGLAGALALAPPARAVTILGWVALMAALLLVGAALRAGLDDPARFGRALTRILGEAFEGSVEAGHFAGATVREVAIAAVISILPPLLAPGGLGGALHATAQAPTTRGQAATALLEPLLYALVTTLLVLAFAATGAYSQRQEQTRPVTTFTVQRSGFETASQRMEADRRFTGIVRIIEGSTGVQPVSFATERGMVTSATFQQNGEEADVMFHVTDGVIDDYQVPEGRFDALTRQPLEEASTVMLTGDMLPRGARLLHSAMASADVATSRLAATALLLLALLGAAAWGHGVRRTLTGRLPTPVAQGAALLPAVGLAVGVLLAHPAFALVGGILAGLGGTAAAIALTVRAREVGVLANAGRK